MAGRFAASQGLAITYKMYVQQPTKTFCNFMQKGLAKNSYYHTDSFHPGHKEKEILTGIQLANELLAQIVDELNSLQIYMDTEIPAANSNESSPIFRLHTIQLLLEVSKTLEAIRKNIIYLTNKNKPQKS